MPLVACSECRRHVNAVETACPFCGAVRTPILVPRLRGGGRISRAAVFVGAAACYTSSPPPQRYAAPPPDPQQQQQPQGQPLEDAQVRWDAEPAGSMPNPAYAPRPRAGRATLLGRVVDSSSLALPGVEVQIEGPEPHRVRSGRGGIFLVENLVPGTYRVIIDRRANPGDGVVEVAVELVAGTVTPMAILGDPPGPAVAKPIDNACCKPYGAPPARRRVV
jgi:hypothetical protein